MIGYIKCEQQKGTKKEADDRIADRENKKGREGLKNLEAAECLLKAFQLWSAEFLCIKENAPSCIDIKKSSLTPLSHPSFCVFVNGDPPTALSIILYRLPPQYDFRVSLCTTPTLLMVWNCNIKIWKTHTGLNNIRLIFERRRVNSSKEAVSWVPLLGQFGGQWVWGKTACTRIHQRQSKRGSSDILFLLPSHI